jgi:hypothetical protein
MGLIGRINRIKKSKNIEMKKHEKALFFYSLIDNLIPFGYHNLHVKMEFAKDYMNNMTIKDLKNNRISFGPMDEKTLQFFIFSILLEYDSIKEEATNKTLVKKTRSIDTERIFPVREMSVEDVVFIEHCLGKIKIDLEAEDHEEFIMNRNQILFLVRGIMREYDTFLSNGGKIEE